MAKQEDKNEDEEVQAAAPRKLRKKSKPPPKTRAAMDLRYSVDESGSLEDLSQSFGRPKLTRAGELKVLMNTKSQKPLKSAAVAYFKDNHLWNIETEKQYKLNEVTFGRDVFDNKFWNKCDPFREGIETDLVEFGPGLSAYFKMLKAFGWVFLIFSILSIPMMVINGVGGDSQPIVTATTVGNLFDDFELSEVESGEDDSALFVRVFVPGKCRCYRFDCFLSREIRHF